MILELIIAISLGILVGTLTGLTPGIHINLVAVMLLNFSFFLLNLTTPIILAIFIVSMAITHTFLDFIPSIFLGAPNEDSFLSILPGHQLLLKGKAYYAIVYTLYGGLAALVIILLFIPIFIYILPLIYHYFQKIMWIILTLVSFLLIRSEPNKKILALIIFLVAGFLGIATLNLNIKEPLLPLLTGLFGASNLLISIRQNTKIPPQKIFPLKNIRLPKSSIAKTFLASIISAPFTAFLPGLGTSEAAIIGQRALNIEDNREFLFLLGAISTIVMGLSFITFYSIQKTRTGAAVAISRLLPEPTMNNLFLIILTIILSGLIAFQLAIYISKFASKNIHKIKYSKLSSIILIILLAIVFIFSDFTLKGKIISLLVFFISTSLGIFTILSGVRRMHLMGCLLVPTILFYLI
ncbi:MAG: tripartite tricarboxylate transporter permease [Nanoarchaeota archaeon]